MKISHRIRLFVVACGLVLATPLCLHAQITAFTYQGRLTGPDGSPVTGTVDLQFRFFHQSTGGTALPFNFENANVTLNNGTLTQELDLGAANTPALFDGQDLWLEITDVTHSVVFPRQHFTATPYAILANTAVVANSLASNTVTSVNIQDATITAAKLAPGQVVKTLNGLTDNVTLAPGANVTLATNGNILTIASTGGGSPANAALLNTNQTFTGSNNFAGVLVATNANNVLSGTLNGAASSFSGVLAGDVTGPQGATVVTPNIPRLNGTNTFTGTNNFSGIVNTLGGLIIENRTSDPVGAAPGRIWLRTDL